MSARTRHVTGLADDAVAQSDLSAAVVPEALDYCFFSGYSENVYPISAASRDIPVLISGPPVPAQDQFDRCLEQVKPLLVKYNNDYCNVVYSGQCSINGAYQPSVNDVKHFIGTSSYRYPWKILLLPDTAPLSHFRKRAEFVCSMSFSQIIHYYEVNNFDAVDDKLGEMIPNYCFLATYTYALLTDGYGFRADQSITVLDQVRGNKVSWALGAILYEINTMPWELDMTWYLKRYILFFWLGIVLTVAVGCGVVWYFRHILVRIVYEKMYNRINDGQNTSMEVSSGIHSYQNINSIYDPKTISSSTLSYQPYNKNDDKNNSNVSQASTIIWNETDQLLTAANLNYNQQNHTNHVSYQNANSNTWMNTDGVKSNRIYDDSSSNDSSPCRNKFMFHHHRPKKTYLDRYSAGQTLPTILSNTSTLVTIDTEENQGIYPSSSHLSSFQALSSINTITNDNISNSATQIEYNNNNSETNIGNKKLAPVSLSVSPATTVATTDSLLYYETLSPMQDGGIEVD